MSSTTTTAPGAPEIISAKEAAKRLGVRFALFQEVAGAQSLTRYRSTRDLRKWGYRVSDVDSLRDGALREQWVPVEPAPIRPERKRSRSRSTRSAASAPTA